MCTPRQNNKKGNTPKILLSSKKINYDQKLFLFFVVVVQSKYQDIILG